MGGAAVAAAAAVLPVAKEAKQAMDFLCDFVYAGSATAGERSWRPPSPVRSARARQEACRAGQGEVRRRTPPLWQLGADQENEEARARRRRQIAGP
eukprot:3481381-Pyramimonas_sp.AAC.1